MAEGRPEERRRYQRVTFVNPVIIHDIVGEYHGIIRNINQEGLSFETMDHIFMVKDKYIFEFGLEKGPNFKLIGEIFWALPSKESNTYGVKFTSLGIFTRMRLKSFVDKIIKHEEKK